MMRKGLLALVLAGTAWCGGLPAQAAEVTLRAVSSFGLNTQFGIVFKDFAEELNKRGKGVMQIRLIGGPEAMPPGEVGSAVKGGVIDMAWSPANFYESQMSEAASMALANVPASEWKKNGAWDLLQKLHNDKVNSMLLTSFGSGLSHYLYLTKKIDKPDLTGMKIRPAPGMQAFYNSLGAATVSTMPGEVYTALERGLIEGYSWPLWGVIDLSWQRVTKYRVEPGYGIVQCNLLVNIPVWNKLEPVQRDFLNKMVAWHENEYAPKKISETSAAEIKKQTEAGIQVITFSPEDGKKFRAAFYDNMWEAAVQKAPQTAPALKALLYRP